MEKTFLAIALLAATGASAQSVTIYGLADVALNSDTKKDTAGNKTETRDLITNGLSASRLGFKGERDIGHALKANFLLEVEVDQSSDAGNVKFRVGSVGLTGGWGGVSFGRRNTLIRDIEATLDANDGPAAAGYLGDNARDARRNDAITYSTPVFSGFSADLQWGLGSTKKETSGSGVVTSDGKSGDAISVGLNYVHGPLTVKWGHETVKSFGKDFKVADTKVVAAPNVAVTTDLTHHLLGAMYDLDTVKLFFVKTASKQGAGATEARLDTKNFGVRVPVGDFSLNAGVSNGLAVLPEQVEKAKTSAVQLSVWYAFNKDTTLYGVLGTEKIKHPSFATNADEKTILAGIRYKF